MSTIPALLDVSNAEADEGQPVEPVTSSLRRFVIAVTVGMAVMTIPYVYLSWDMWSGSLDPLRGVAPRNFYELQANALVHGHLWIPKQDLGIEAFFHGSHAYTYFGLFPSLIRLPFMALIPSLDDHLTGPSIFAAWILTGLLTGLLMWRVRVLARGAAPMGWAETVGSGFLMASIMGGSVLVFLASTPWVYNEDLAWSVTLTVGCLFTLLGVLERPSWSRVGWAGLFLLATNLNRLSTAWACVIGAVLIAGWFALGRGGVEQRRWALPVAAAGLIPFCVGTLVTWWKFGALFSVPLAHQEWTLLNAHRRHYLKVNGGKAFRPQFLPSTVVAYFGPDGIHFTSLFPYVTFPTAPAAVVGHVVLDETYQTASVESSMPLLFLLSIWGVITAFRRRSAGLLRLTRLLLLAAAAATAGVMLVGYIAERYQADLLPVFILAGIIGSVDLWRRVANRRKPIVAGLTAAIAVLTAFSIVANMGGTLASVTGWSTGQARGFVEAQRSLSVGSLAASVHHGATLPAWAPTDEIFDVGNCSGLYLSTGVYLSTVPSQQVLHANWIPVEQSAGINYAVTITVTRQIRANTPAIPLFRYGTATVILQPISRDKVGIVLQNPGRPPGSRSGAKAGKSGGGKGKLRAGKGVESGAITMRLNHTYYFQVEADPNLNQIQVRSFKPQTDSGNISTVLQNSDSAQLFSHYVAWHGPGQVVTTNSAAGTSPYLTIREIAVTPPTMELCHSLQRGS